MRLTIGWLYPKHMSTYGDRGNIICLQKRGEWRNIKIKIKEISFEDDFKDCDLLFMGGAQDRQQKLIIEDLLKNKGPLIKEAVENELPALFVCAAYQLMGRYYQPAEGERLLGTGLFDLYTKHPGLDAPRLIGNIVIENDFLEERIIVGFENHGGRTFLGKGVKALGKVKRGFGNNGEDKTEGVIYHQAIGSYLHGPLLPKNPCLADFFLSKALEKKYGKEIKLKTLNDRLEKEAHQFAKNCRKV